MFSIAILDLGQTNYARYQNDLIAAAEFVTVQNVPLGTAFFSSHATFSIPISLNLLTNAILKNATSDEYSISVSAQQLPRSLQSTVIPELNVDVYSTVLLFVFFLFPAIALFVIHPLRESLSNVKQLQRMAGVSCFTYWGTMFIVDFLVFLIAICFIVIGFICMDILIDLRLYENTEIGTSSYIHINSN